MILKIEQIKKSYDKKLVLDVEEMTIERGINCLLGANGCGKTTLLNILAGQLKSDSGKVLYEGQKYSKKLAKDLTLVQQKPYLFERSVFENIAYPLHIRKYSAKQIKEKVTQMMSLFNIEELEEKKGTELSGGETQKVALARAMVFEPSLLMLDEAMSNVDVHSVPVIEAAVKAYAKRGKTVLMVTHDIEQADRMADRKIWL